MQRGALLRAVVRIARTTTFVEAQMVLAQETVLFNLVAPVIDKMVRYGAVARILLDARGQDARAAQCRAYKNNDPRYDLHNLVVVVPETPPLMK